MRLRAILGTVSTLKHRYKCSLRLDAIFITFHLMNPVQLSLHAASVSNPEQKEACIQIIFKNLDNPQHYGQNKSAAYINQNDLRLFDSFPCEKTLAMLNTIGMLAFDNLITVA